MMGRHALCLAWWWDRMMLFCMHLYPCGLPGCLGVCHQGQSCRVPPIWFDQWRGISTVRISVLVRLCMLLLKRQVRAACMQPPCPLLENWVLYNMTLSALLYVIAQCMNNHAWLLRIIYHPLNVCVLMPSHGCLITFRLSCFDQCRGAFDLAYVTAKGPGNGCTNVCSAAGELWV
jgi:hypothetical protein